MPKNRPTRPTNQKVAGSSPAERPTNSRICRSFLLALPSVQTLPLIARRMRAAKLAVKRGRRSLMASEWQQTSSRGILPLSQHHIWGEHGWAERGVGGPTGEWEQLKLLCRWPEQLAYEEIRPTVLFGSSVRDRAEETGSSERTLYRKAARFDREGIDSHFDSAGAKRRELPPVVRRMIVELKGRVPRLQPRRDGHHLLRPYRQAARQAHYRTGPL